MVWIIGEYAERIDNADELLESFLEVCLCTLNGPMCYCFPLQTGNVCVAVNKPLTWFWLALHHLCGRSM